MPPTCTCKVGKCPICFSSCKRCQCECDGESIADKTSRKRGQRKRSHPETVKYPSRRSGRSLSIRSLDYGDNEDGQQGEEQEEEQEGAGNLSVKATGRGTKVKDIYINALATIFHENPSIKPAAAVASFLQAHPRPPEDTEGYPDEKKIKTTINAWKQKLKKTKEMPQLRPSLW